MRSLRLILGSLFLVLAATFAFGQATLGIVAGTVTDHSGAVVVGATISAQRTEGGDQRTATSGPNGEYRLEALTPGTYRVTVTAPNFSATELANVVVSSSVTTPANVRLEVGKTTETVTVEASAQQVQTETGDLSAVIPQVEIKDLPIASGNPYDLAKTLPGVLVGDSRTTGFSNGAEFSVDGLRARANNFLIDGFDNNDYGITGQALQPTNQEAVSEVTVLKNSYAAEYGRGGGSVSNLTYRSGTNTIHGAAWEQYSGNSLFALTPEESASGLTAPPHVVNNLFGFRVGGRLIKDKLFYFGTSQWQRNFGAPSPLPTTLTIPTQAGVDALQSMGPNNNVQVLVDSLGGLRGSTADPTQVNTINVGNRAGCGSPCLVEVGPFTRTDTTKGVNREWTVRVDYLPTSVDNIFVRYTDTQNSFSPDLFANPAALPTADTQQGGPARNMGVMWAHTFGPRVVNEFRFSAQTINFGFNPTAATLANPLAHLPGLTLAASFGPTLWGGFSQGTFPQFREHKTLQFQDAVSFTRGSHTFKIGADLAILLVQDQIPFNSDGTIVYSSGGDCSTIGLTDCTDLANYIDDFSGPAGTIDKQFGNPLISVPTNQQAYYFQDSWKVRPNLTVNYGLRYEYQPPDANNVLSFPAVNRATVLTDPFEQRNEVRPDRNNWGPRFGFSYAPRGRFFGENKTVIRGGAGIFFDSFFSNINDNTAATAPNTLGGNIFGGPASRGTSGTFAAISAIAPVSDPTNTVFAVTSDLRNPETYQWNLNVQRELPGKLIAEVAYVGTRGTRLWASEQLNPAVPDLAAGTDDRLNPNRGSIVARANRGDSNYHGLQAEVSRSVGRLTVLGAYTFSRAIDNSSDIFATSGGASRWEITNNPRSDRGPSAFDHKQRVAITWLYAFPSPSNSVLKAILGGWSSTGSVAFQSGAPETVFLGGWDQNGDGEAFNDRPFQGNLAAKVNESLTCLSNPTCNTGVGFNDGSGNLIDFIQALFQGVTLPVTADQVRYVVYDFASGKNGNVGRNSFYLPGTQTWNLGVIKRFRIPFHESQVEFRGDFFNAFNHPNEGVNVSGYGDLLSPGVFGNPRSTLSGARQIQLWLKYSF
jgi:Carboxypeptidase regulatory-like domain/TonB-dependent Receptor Plug Domain